MKNRKPPPKGPVLVFAPLKPAASPNPRMAEEERGFAGRYLRLADTALKDDRGKLQVMTGLGGAMDQTRVKVVKYEPLTFACVACGRQFGMGDKDLSQLSKEVMDHLLQEHPEQPLRAERKAA